VPAAESEPFGAATLVQLVEAGEAGEAVSASVAATAMSSATSVLGFVMIEPSSLTRFPLRAEASGEAARLC
jgi:hypothetical protein